MPTNSFPYKGRPRSGQDYILNQVFPISVCQPWATQDNPLLAFVHSLVFVTPTTTFFTHIFLKTTPGPPATTMTTTYLDPMFFKKIPGTGFAPFKDRVEASLAFGRPPPKPVPLTIEAQRISRMNLELLEDNVAADEKITSLATQIEQGRVVLTHKHARICSLKGQLDSSRTRCASLESQLGEQTKNASAYKLRIEDLEKELGDARTNITALEADVIDKEADVEVLRNHKDMMYAVETELLTALRDECRELDAVRKAHSLEIAGMKGRLIWMKDDKEQVEKALGEESARLAGVQAELKDTKEKLRVEQDKAKELRDANEALGGEIAELKWSLEEKEYELGQAKEKIASLELSLATTEEKLSDAQRTILQGCEALAHAKEEHEGIQATLTDRCSDLSISLELTQDELTDVKSQLEAAEGQLIDIEDFVFKQEAEIRQKDEEIARLQKQVVDEGEQAKADIEVRGVEIAELHDELGGMQTELEETQNGWKLETGDLKERLGETEGELQDLRDGFGVFKEATRVKEVALEGRVTTLENEVRFKDAALAESEAIINNLTTEVDTQGATVQNTIVTLLQAARSGREERAAGLAKLQAIQNGFGVFREVAQANEEELEGRIKSLEDEVKFKDVELGVAHDKVKELENKISNLIIEADTRDATLRNTIAASLLTVRDAEEQMQAELSRQITLERKVEELTKDLRDRDDELATTRTRLEASDNQIVELNIQLADKDKDLHNAIAGFIQARCDGQARIDEAIAWSNDLDALIEEKDARILELESQLTTSVPPPIPVLDLEVTTIVPLDIDEAPPSDIVPTCNLPQDADYFAKIAPEAAYESSDMGVDAGPDLLDPHCAKVLATRPQRRGVYKIRTPYSTTRLGVRGNIIVSTHDLITGETINLGDPTKVPKRSVATPGPQLSATAPSFTPSLGQSSVEPPQLRPSAPSFAPRPSAVESPQLHPDIPSFTPCQPPLPLRVTQLRANLGEFAPRPQLGGLPRVGIPCSPITPTYIPRQPSPVIPFAPSRIPTPIGQFYPRPHLGRPPFANVPWSPIAHPFIPPQPSHAPPFIPARTSTPIAPLHFAPYPSPFPPFAPYPSPFPPFARPVAPFVPTRSYTNNNMCWTPPDRDNVSGAVRTDTDSDARAGEAEPQDPTGPSPPAQSNTEHSVASVPSTDRVAQIDDDVIVSTHKSFPNLCDLRARARQDPSVVEPEPKRISTRSSCLL
ncbi:hypothetical protein NLI96_g9052 [Meripilus lineatus]|uniref:Uncharacterized protein n=1 Tax=Meripilus lineatus TaxID=2056292 RepID=A0AAD5YFM6_9APHY|nr:hypothetical protein NLI96_g9052 [Physisporinus lineatus]